MRKRPPSARQARRGARRHDFEVRAASRGIHGAPKVFQELRKAGVRTSASAWRASCAKRLGWTTRGCARRNAGRAATCAAPDLVKRLQRGTGRTGCGSRASPA